MPNQQYDCTKPNANRGEAFSAVEKFTRHLRAKNLRFTVETDKQAGGTTRLVIETDNKSVGYDAKKERADQQEADRAAKEEAERAATAEADKAAAEEKAKAEKAKETNKKASS